MPRRNPVRGVYLITSHPTDRSGEFFDWIDDCVTLDSAAASQRLEKLKTAGIHDEPGRRYFVRPLRFETEGTADVVLLHAIQGLTAARKMLADEENQETGHEARRDQP